MPAESITADTDHGLATPDISRWTVALGLGAILLVVAALRVVPLQAHDWALGDGGLFYRMIGDILAAEFRLPVATSYQAGAIPFAYPPLGFYLGAAIEGLTGAERVTILRLLPTLMSVAAVAAMYPLAAELGPSRRHALVATAFFGALLGLQGALVAGGGLTRTLGLLLALLATWQGIRMFRRGGWRYVASTAVLAGLAVAAHPEAGPFMAIALGAAWLTRWRSRDAFVALAMAALGALLMISPWLIAVATQHGFGPWLSTLSTTDHGLVDMMLAYAFLFVVVAPVVGILDLVGQVQQVLARRPHLLAWRVGVFALDLRFSPVAGAAPVSLLAAHGTLDVLVPAMARLAARLRPRRATRSGRERLGSLVVGVTIALAFVPALRTSLDATAADAAIGASQREAMTWVRDNAAAETRTVSLATEVWGSDIVSEWFPALSERVSAVTGQGLEWTSQARDEQRRAEAALRDCQQLGQDQAGCVDRWLHTYLGDEEVVVYLDRSAAPEQVGALGDALIRDLGYRQLWQGGDGVIVAPPAG